MGQVIDVKVGNRGCAFNDRFQFESIGVLITQNIIGITCDDKIYWNHIQQSSASSSSSLNGQGQLPLNWGFGVVNISDSGTCDSNRRDWYAYRINQYGDIEIDTGYSLKSSGGGGGHTSINGDFRDYFCSDCSCDPDSSFSDQGEYIAIKEPFGVLSESSNGTIYCGPGPGRVGTGSCNSRRVGYSNYSCSATSKENVECPNKNSARNGADSLTSIIISYCNQAYIKTLPCRDDPSPPPVGCFRGIGGARSRDYSENNTSIYSDEKNWNFFFGLAKQSSGAKLDILEFNKPQNSNGDTCGEGGPEDCWGGWGGTSVSDTGEGAGSTSATSQRWKTRVRKVDLNDEELQKYTITVESKYYLQIPVEGSSPIRILVDSGTDTFSANQSRGGKHEFTNEDFQAQVGQPIYGCINITRIDRL